MATSPATFPAVLTERRDSGAGLSLVTLTPAPGRAPTYRAPGQYIAVRAPEDGYFVLAGEIGAPSWELLVRRNGGASDALLGAPEGAEFDVAGPLGDGFPIERAHGRPLVVAVAGSALAVTRPIVRSRIARREGHSTSVYIGARTAFDVALADEVAGWVQAGVRVILCLSRPRLDGDDASSAKEQRHLLSATRRASGYVQRVLANDVVEGVVTSGLVFAAGPPGMLEELRGVQRSFGPELEVVTNV